MYGYIILKSPAISQVNLCRLQLKATCCTNQRPSQSSKTVIFFTKVKKCGVLDHCGAIGTLAERWSSHFMQEWQRQN